MKTLVLKNNFQMNMTMLPNSFVDHYMANANGEFVKVYLFLLRHVEDAASSLSISMIADYLNNTENDVPMDNKLLDVEEALVALGYNKKEVSKILPKLDKSLEVGALVKEALKLLVK